MLALVLLILAATRALAAPCPADQVGDRDPTERERPHAALAAPMGEAIDEAIDEAPSDEPWTDERTDEPWYRRIDDPIDDGFADREARLALDPDADRERAADERAAIATGARFRSAAFDDPAALRDPALRHQRPSRWGRLDLSLTWRRAWTGRFELDPALGAPRYRIARGDTLWLLATWRR